jgi:hypothetical protein
LTDIVPNPNGAVRLGLNLLLLIEILQNNFVFLVLIDFNQLFFVFENFRIEPSCFILDQLTVFIMKIKAGECAPFDDPLAEIGVFEVIPILVVKVFQDLVY